MSCHGLNTTKQYWNIYMGKRTTGEDQRQESQGHHEDGLQHSRETDIEKAKHTNRTRTAKYQ